MIESYAKVADDLTTFFEKGNAIKTNPKFSPDRFINASKLLPWEKGHFVTEVSTNALHIVMNKKARIFFSEGYRFGKAGGGFERVNLAVPTEYLEKMLERLYEVLKIEFPKFCKNK